MAGKKEKIKTELRLKIWAIIDGSSVLAHSLTYDEASKKNQKLNGTIVTNDVAVRLNASVIES